jgi:formylglycine-generating enzyme required for sulfatase activity
MGSPESESGRRASEGPVRKVVFKKPFAVGRYSVARDEFMAFVSATGYRYGQTCHAELENKWVDVTNASFRAPPGFSQDGRHPAVCISWEEAEAYVKWLSQHTQRSYRLLTEAEREYVTRAGTSTSYWWGDSAAPAYANYDTRERAVTPTVVAAMPQVRTDAMEPPAGGTKAVNSFRENPWGFFNVHGNVGEWVKDCWNATYAEVPTDGSAAATGDCARRVVRGGAWSYWPEDIRAAYREAASANDRYFHIGFRVARDLAQ